MSFIDLLKARRTVYELGSIMPTQENVVDSLVKECISQCPSAFNSQPSMAIILYGKNHELLWELLKNKVKDISSPVDVEANLQKFDFFSKAYGTILFYEDQDMIKSMEIRFPHHANSFQNWSQQGSGIVQFAVWTGLIELGLGANIQHYNDLLDEAYPLFNIERKYKLVAQMPFGSITEAPYEKLIFNIDKRCCIRR